MSKSEKPPEDPEGRKNTPETQWPLGLTQKGTQGRVSTTLENRSGIGKPNQGGWF